jgi:hypothetical protein
MSKISFCPRKPLRAQSPHIWDRRHCRRHCDHIYDNAIEASVFDYLASSSFLMGPQPERHQDANAVIGSLTLHLPNLAAVG